MKRWLWRALQLALLVLVGWGIYRMLAPELARVSLADFREYRPATGRLVLSIMLLVLVNLMHGWIWRRIAVALSGADLSIRAAMKLYFVSSLGRYIPGKLWQLAGIAALAQKQNFSPVAATAASLVGQLAFLTTGILFLAVLLPALLLDIWLRNPPSMETAALAAVILLAVAVGAFMIMATGRGKALRHRLVSRLGPRLAQAVTLLDRMKTRDALAWWALYAVTWILLGAAFTLFIGAFVPVHAAQYRDFAGVVAASYLGGYLFFLIPAGIGIREGLMAGLLSTALPAPAAVLISILSRVWFTAGELLPLLLIPVLPGSTVSGGEVQ